MLRELWKSITATIVLTLLCCVAYPAVVWAIGQAAFPRQANGSLIVRDGKVIGSELIGQTFSGAKYFQSRPSAAGTGYDAANSSGSNLGPTSQKLIDTVKQRVEEYRKANGLSNGTPVPADAVTASASGLDPHISVENARLQAARVARERGLPAEKIDDLIRKHTAGPDLGILGDAAVNVVTLNLELDALQK